MIEKHQYGSMELYPQNSHEMDLKRFRGYFEIHGEEFEVDAYATSEIKHLRGPKRLQDLSTPWGPAESNFPDFIRFDLNSGHFMEQWAYRALTSDQNEYWQMIHRLAVVSLFVSETFAQEHVLYYRQFDPLDSRKKRTKSLLTPGSYDGAELISREMFSQDTIEILWQKTIPELAKKAVSSPNLFNDIELNKQDSEIIEQALSIYRKFSTDMNSAQTTFNRKFHEHLKSTEPNPIQESITRILSKYYRHMHMDMSTAFEKLRKVSAETLNEMSKSDRERSATSRYMDFWYSPNSPIGANLSPLILALTPIRSFIHRQKYKILADFEQSLFINNELPKLKTLAAIASYVASYKMWLEESRAYKRKNG